MKGPEDILAASPLAGQPGLRWRPGLPTIASPMRQATDASNWIVEADEGEPIFLKTYEEDAAAVIDLEAAWEGVCAAERAGVGPHAQFALLEHRAIATNYLAPPWRAAFLNHLAEPVVLEAAIAAKRRLHVGSPLGREWDLFIEIERMLARAKVARVWPPREMPVFAAWSRKAGAAVAAAGADKCPCHNDGSASSVMVGPGGAVRLVDFDCAGQSDPFSDLALLLNEASAFGDGWEAGVECYAGRADALLVNRCRVYAVADDILRGLWGYFLSATSPRRSVEFLKYGEWRLLRARMALRESGFADRLRRL